MNTNDIIAEIKKLKKELEAEIDEAWEIARRSLEKSPDDMILGMLGKCLGKKDLLKMIKNRTTDEFTRRLVSREVCYKKSKHKIDEEYPRFDISILYAKVEMLDKVLPLIPKDMELVNKKEWKKCQQVA